MLHITFSGIDKSGKTTLINAFMEETNYEHYVVDRDPSNYFFFNVLRDRISGSKQFFEYENFQKRFNKCIDLAILLYANEKDIIERFETHNEPDLVGNLSIEDHQKELEFFFDNAKYKNALRLNTSNLSVEECVKLIQDKIKCL